MLHLSTIHSTRALASSSRTTRLVKDLFTSVKCHQMLKTQHLISRSYFGREFLQCMLIKHSFHQPICVTKNFSAHALSLEKERFTNSTTLNQDIKSDAVDIFKHAVNSVQPRKMIEKVLQYNREASTLTVEGKVYQLKRNIFLVGFGKATLGMARAVEDILGEHFVSGIISIPRGLPKEMAELQHFDSLLSENSKIEAYEGSYENQVDEAAYHAAVAIKNMVSKLAESDLVIVLSSGGGSVLLPFPHPPISLDDLIQTNRLLAHQGASQQDLSTARKNIELLKGGGLVVAAQPAQILCLGLSSTVGDSFDQMACGPTYPCQPTPRHCLQILQQLGVTDKVPESVREYLKKKVQEIDVIQSDDQSRLSAKAELENLWRKVQNVVVGNNTVACEKAAKRAEELGYVPMILTTTLQGEARRIGALCAKMAQFMMVCYDRRVSLELNQAIASMELDMVKSGLRKQWLNRIIRHTDRAHHMNRDICIILGGDMVVSVKGDGIGGKNMECVLGTVSQFRKNGNLADEVVESKMEMTILSADTDGHDGVTKFAGAVIDKEFVVNVVKGNLDVDKYLDDSNSLRFFESVNEGKNLIDTKLTGTNVMDLILVLVKRPTS